MGCAVTIKSVETLMILLFKKSFWSTSNFENNDLYCYFSVIRYSILKLCLIPIANKLPLTYSYTQL